MKKVICLIILVCIAMTFLSCNQNETTSQDEAPVVSEYTIIYSDKASVLLIRSVTDLVDFIEKTSGYKVNTYKDKDTNYESSGFEILIGFTNRRETRETLSEIANERYIIKLFDEKLIITGASDTLSIEAINAFKIKYVKTNGLAIPDGLSDLSEKIDVLTIADNGKSDFSVVYSDKLDDTPIEAKDSIHYKNGGIDCEVACAQNVQKLLASKAATSIKIKTDWDTNIDKYEIVIGVSKKITIPREKYDLDEYGYFVLDKKIVVFGWNERTISLATEMLSKYISEAVSVKPDGSKILQILASTSVTYNYSAWVTDIPSYDGGAFGGTYDGGSNNLMLLYTDTSAAGFNAYCLKLEQNGYSLYSENEQNGNLFATYVKEKTFIHLYYIEYDKSVRIISGTTTADNELVPVTTDSYTKITDSSVTLFGYDYNTENGGLGMIVTLEDSSFIIIDGGTNGSGQITRLYNLLKKLNQREDGKIIIAAWIITHDHNDHFGLFKGFCAAYGSNITIEKFIYNTPTAYSAYNTWDYEDQIESNYLIASRAVGGFQMIRAYTGQKFTLRNAEIEVLYTSENLYPNRIQYYNSASLVSRISVGGQSIFILGDAGPEASDILCNFYGSTLKSDIVQVSHHGWDGGTIALYSYIDPSVALWPCSNAHTIEQRNANSIVRGVNYGAVAKWLWNNSNIKEHYTASSYCTMIPLPYTAGTNQAVKITINELK